MCLCVFFLFEQGGAPHDKRFYSYISFTKNLQHKFFFYWMKKIEEKTPLTIIKQHNVLIWKRTDGRTDERVNEQTKPITRIWIFTNPINNRMKLNQICFLTSACAGWWEATMKTEVCDFCFVLLRLRASSEIWAAVFAGRHNLCVCVCVRAYNSFLCLN